MDNASSNFQAGWNLAEPMLFDIANRLKVSRDNLLRGGIETYYWNLEVIMRMMYGFFTEEEKKNVMEKEMKIQKLLPCTKQNKGELSMLLKEYDGLVMTVLHNHKFLVPPKIDRTRLIS